jgi:hypothetical protein
MRGRPAAALARRPLPADVARSARGPRHHGWLCALDRAARGRTAPLERRLATPRRTEVSARLCWYVAPAGAWSRSDLAADEPNADDDRPAARAFCLSRLR